MVKHLLPVLTATMVLAGTAATSAAETAEPVTLYGVKISSSKENESRGLFSFKAEPGSQPECVYANGSFQANGGAVYTDDGTVYALSYFQLWGDNYFGYMIYNVADQTYEYLNSNQLDLVLREDVAGTMTYDPSSDSIYAVCLRNDGQPGYVLSMMNRKTAKKSVVTPIPQRLFTLACTARGVMYGIGEDGYLYIVDKHNGELTPVGNTGLIPSVNQSAVIDYKTNIMYWNAITADQGGALYTVDLETAEANLITVFENSYQFACLYLEQVAQVPTAPSAATDFTPNFVGASLSGNFSFTLPTVDINGDQLSGTLDYTVSCDGTVLATGSGNPGEAVVADVEVPETGLRRFVLNVENNGEPGPGVSLEMWVGMDTPQAVEDLTVSIDGDLATVSWTLPERGIHDGFVDHDLVRFQIIRGPEEVVVDNAYAGTSISETVVRDDVYPLMYMVTPAVSGLIGESKIGNIVLAGSHFEPPFDMNLRDPFMSLIFKIEDANGDMATWEYIYDYEAMKCYWPLSNDLMRDDWLITPAVHLEPGFEYTVNSVIRSEGAWNYDIEDYEDVFAGDLTIYLGREQDITSLTRPLCEKEEVTSWNWYKHETDAFSVEEDGKYYIGFHVTGGIEVRNIYGIVMQTISMTKKEVSSVANIDSDRFYVMASNGSVAVHNPNCEEVRIFTLDGRTVAATSEMNSSVQLGKGIYIVACGGESTKVIVK